MLLYEYIDKKKKKKWKTTESERMKKQQNSKDRVRLIVLTWGGT